MEKIHKPVGRVCQISQNLIFFFDKWKKWKKMDQKKIRLHKTHTGRAGQHFMNLFHKIPFFFLNDGFPYQILAIPAHCFQLQ